MSATRRFLQLSFLCLLVLPGSMILDHEVMAQTKRGLVVALGASNTAGQGVSPNEAYPAQLEALLNARGVSVQVLNEGVSGDTSAGMLARLEADVPQGTRLVLLQIGSNDAAAGVDHGSTLANLRQITQLLRARHLPVIRVDSAFGRVGSAMRQADGVHLTAEGYRRVAAELLPAVLKVLR